MIIKIILFIFMLSLIYKVFMEYNKLYHTKEYYRKTQEVYARYYNNLVNQLYDIKRDDENKITTQTLKEPFVGYINEEMIK